MTIARGDGEPAILEEDELRKISRNIRALIPNVNTDEGELKDFQYLFEQVLVTSNTSGLVASHRVAAWNTLCSLIDQSLESDSPIVLHYVSTGDVWKRAFRLYLSHAQSARPKSSRQLLVTLTNGLGKSHGNELDQHRQFGLENIILSLNDFQNPYAAKASAQLLSYLLHKSVVDLQKVLTVHQQFGRPHVTHNLKQDALSGDSLVGLFQELLRVLFRWLGRGDFGSTVAQLVSTLLDEFEAQGLSGSIMSLCPVQAVWTDPLAKAVQVDSVEVDDLRAHILPVLFKRKFSDFVAFLSEQGLYCKPADMDSRQTIFYAAMQTGKELDLVAETDGSEICNDQTRLFVPLPKIGQLLLQNSRPARLTGLALLVHSHSLTRPFSRTALDWIKRGLEIFSADNDADFRGNLFSAFQKLMDRLRAVSAVLDRKIPKSTVEVNQMPSQNITALQTTLSYHKDFLDWSLRFLAWELRPTASYQRHISSLKVLSIMMRSGLDDTVPAENWSRSALLETKWPFHISIFSADLGRLLLDLLLDPFDDVRQTAASILNLYSAKGLFPAQLSLALARAESIMLKTGRADQADGVAHIYALCSRNCHSQGTNAILGLSSREAIIHHVIDRLNETIDAAHRDLAEAVEKHPMHGLLVALRYLLMDVQISLAHEVYPSMIEQVHNVWNLVEPVLCNDAPEGYVPEELEDSSESTKETLSYCWRALKEASLLLNTIGNNVKFRGDFPAKDMLERMGSLCFKQLARLRHRGAFSTVAQTWTTLCIQCRNLFAADNTPLLQMWYTNALSMLRNRVRINTRRSAGLPALLCGILIADQAGLTLDRGFSDLEVIAREQVDITADEGSLPQVHAMNCLKEILKNSKLGEKSERYVPAALQLAADALRSDVWAIRNCGLMLFRALIDRLLGTDKSHFDGDELGRTRISAERHPELLDLVLGLLDRSGLESASRYEDVFPALQLLEQTRIPPIRRLETFALVRNLFASPYWHVREKSAQTLSLLMIREKPHLTLADLESFLNFSHNSENIIHGTLMTAQHVLRNLRNACERQENPAIHDPDFITAIQHLRNLSASIMRLSEAYMACFVLQAAVMDLAREYFFFTAAFAQGRNIDIDCKTIFRAIQENIRTSGVPGSHGRHVSQYLHSPAMAIARQAMARLCAQQLLSGTVESRQDAEHICTLIIELANKDPDACTHFFKMIKGQEVAHHIISALINVAGLIIRGEVDMRLQLEAQGFLLGLASQDQHSVVDLLDNLVHDKPYLHRRECNQIFADQWLQLRAIRLDDQAERSSMLSDPLLEEIAAWVEDCALAVEDRGLYTREAAAESIACVKSLWTVLASEKRLDSVFQRLAVSVYDLLNDDDEEMRLLAVTISCRILRATGAATRDCEVEPITSGRRLLGMILSRWRVDVSLAKVAIRRGFGISEENIVAVADQLGPVASDGALFAEEKQNLYVDEAKEARAWAQVARGLSPAVVPHVLTSALALWVSDGLDVVLRKASAEKDGPLGWSSGTETFTLGLRVIYGAEVLLQWATNGVRIPVRPSAVRQKLHECSEAFRSQELHLLWRWEAERVLIESVLGKMRAAAQRAACLAAGNLQNAA